MRKGEERSEASKKRVVKSLTYVKRAVIKKSPADGKSEERSEASKHIRSRKKQDVTRVE